MIIVTARLVFESEAARDAAVAATVDVQKATLCHAVAAAVPPAATHDVVDVTEETSA